MDLRWRAFRRVSWIWLASERIYMRFHPLTPICPGSLFAFRRVANVLELHLDSRALSRLRTTPGYSTFKAVHEMREELGLLASRVRMGELGSLAGVKGKSLMGKAGAVLGFETRPLPRNFANVLQQYFMVGLDALYNPRGLRPRAMQRWPVETWMSIETLLQSYPEKSARSTVAR